MSATRTAELGWIFLRIFDHCNQPSVPSLLRDQSEALSRIFRGAPQVKIHPQNADIDEFVQRRLESEPKLHAHATANAGLVQFIRDAVLEKRQGMSVRTTFVYLFWTSDGSRLLLAKLHMDALAKKTKCSKIAVINAASLLPSELNATYHDALERINSQDEEDSHLVRQILSWICLTYEPLTLRLLQQA